MPTTLAVRAQRFWAKVEKTDTCWMWKGGVSSSGYGMFCGGRQFPITCAHRVAYEFACGPIPAGKEIDHLCRVRTCVNPAHLEAVTRSENMRRIPSAPRPQLRKARCANGHEFTPENTVVYPKDGARRCRECVRARARIRVWR
jgi:hypothetical protein